MVLGDLSIMDVTSETNMGACPGAKTKKYNYSIKIIRRQLFLYLKPKVGENFRGADILKDWCEGCAISHHFDVIISALSISIVKTIVR